MDAVIGKLAAVCLLAGSSAAAANLISNSSFEAGVDSRIAIARWYVDGLTAARLDSTTQIHGRYSLMIPFSRFGYTAKPRRFDGIGVRAATPVVLSGGQQYSLTVWAKSDPPVRGQLYLLETPPSSNREAVALISREVLIGKKWRRIGLVYPATRDTPVYWALDVNSERPGFLWLDAVQLESGRHTPYQPAQAVEAALWSPREGKIFASGESPTLTLRASNSGTQHLLAQSFRITVRSLSETVVHVRDINADLPAGMDLEQQVALPTLPNGIYRAVLAINGSDDTESELQFSVLPPLRDVPARNGNFGICATLAPEPLRILRRVGFSWLCHMTSNNPIIYWALVEPRPGEYVWYDEEMALAGALGYQMMFHLEPCKTPGWARNLPRAERIARWSDYVRAMIRHYGPVVSDWTIADEVHGGLDPRSENHACWTRGEEYVPWHLAGVQALRSVDPAAKVVLNVQATLAESLLPQLPPGTVDILADNTWHAPELFRRSRVLADRHGINEMWAPGVAVPTGSWYRAHRGGAGPADAPAYWTGKNRELAKGVIRTLALGAKRLFQYTGTHVGNTNFFSVFEADSGLKPIGAQFGALIWLLDGTLRAREIPAGSEEQAIRAFRFERDDGRTVFALWGPPVARQAAMLPEVTAGMAAVHDQFANAVSAQPQGGTLAIPMGRDVVFLLPGPGAADHVEAAIRRMRLKPEALPDGSQVQQAGRYAVVHDIADGVHRPAPNISLWYQSEQWGWQEILRYRASDTRPAYRATSEGFLIEWDFQRPAGAFSLEPGQLPADLAAGARWYASRPGTARAEWRSGRIDLRGGAVIGDAAASKPEGMPAAAGVFTTRLESPRGVVVQMDTQLLGASQAHDEQLSTFGGWDLLIRPGKDCFLHKYFRPAVAGPVRIRVLVRVSEEPVPALTPVSRSSS